MEHDNYMDFSKIYIFGTGGHAREIVNQLIANYRSDSAPQMLQDRFIFVIPFKEPYTFDCAITQCMVTMTEQAFDFYLKKDLELRKELDSTHTSFPKARVVFGIGSPKVREKLFKKFRSQKNVEIINVMSSSTKSDFLQHSTASLVCRKSWQKETFRGVYIAPGVRYTINIDLADGVHLNTGCIVCHDVSIGKHSIISPGAVICGNVTIGKRCYIGAGATIRDGVTIGDDITVGCGATVVNNLPLSGTYVGIPAKLF